MPPEPEPSKFSDWSSEESPPARNNAQNQNQLNVSTAGVDNSVQTEQLRENQDIPVRPIRSDLASNEGNVTIILPIPMQSAQSSFQVDDEMNRNAPHRSSTHDIDIAGISSICPVSSSVASGIRQIVLDNRASGASYQPEGIHPPRTSTAQRRDSSESSDVDRFPRGRGYSNERGRPPEREGYPSRDRRPPRRRGMPSNGRPPDGSHREPSDGGGPPYRGLPDRGGSTADGGPPDDGGPPSDGESSDGNGGPPRCPNRRGTPGPRGPPGPVRPVLIQQPQVVLDTTALENTFDNMGQSMLQLARVQDQTNRHFKQHIQQGHINMQAHAGALHELAKSTHQRNYAHIFASIPVYDGSNRDEFFPWLDRLEAAC